MDEPDNFLEALISKLKANPIISAMVEDRIVRLLNPNDVNILKVYSKLPFIGVTPEVIDREHGGSQQVDESLKPKIWIFHQQFKNEQLLLTELDRMQKKIKKQLEYDVDFDNTEYSGSQIIEAFCIQLGAPEPIPDHEWAGRISLTMEYQRVTEEVLI